MGSSLNGDLFANVYPMLFIMSILMAIGLVSVLISCISEGKVDSFLIPVSIMFLAFGIGGSWSYSYSKDLKEERSELLAEFLKQPREFTEVKISDIINVETLDSEHCLILEEGQTCYLLDIVSDSGVSQVFMGLASSISSKGNSQITMRIYDFTKEERDFIYNFTKMKYIANSSNQKLVKDGEWSIALTMQ